MEVSIGGGRRGRAPVVLIRRIAELGAASDSGGQTPQALVGGTFVFPLRWPPYRNSSDFTRDVWVVFMLVSQLHKKFFRAAQKYVGFWESLSAEG